MKKYFTLSLLLLVIVLQMSLTFADTIDRDTAIEMTIETSDTKESLEDNFLNLHANMAKLYRYAEQQKNAEENYDEMINMMNELGIPVADEMIYTGEAEYNAFYSMQIQYESVYAQYLAMKDTLDTIDLQLISGVDQIMTNLLYLNEAMPIQDDYIDIEKGLLDDAETKYQLGLISENEYKDTQDDYLIALYERQQMYYTKDNLELQFKQMLGLGIDDEITLVEAYLSPNASLADLDTYISNAMVNRIDIKSAEYQLDSAEKIYSYNVKSVYDWTNVIRAQMAVDQYEDELKNAKIDVTKDIMDAYNSVDDAKASLKIAQQNYILSIQTEEQAKISYEQGLITSTDLDLAGISKRTALANVKSSVRSLYLAVETLNNKTVVSQ